MAARLEDIKQVIEREFDKELMEKCKLTDGEVLEATQLGYEKGVLWQDFGFLTGRIQVAKAQLLKALKYCHPSIKAQELQIEIAKRNEREKVFSELEHLMDDVGLVDIGWYVEEWGRRYQVLRKGGGE